MPRFASPAKQANSIINALRKDRTIPSIRSGENYKERLTIIGSKAAEWGLPMLRDMSVLDCIHYLERRSEEVRQATLDTERLALQYTLELMGTLNKTKNERLPTDIKSKLDEIKTSRAYTRDQVDLVKSRMSEKYRLIVEIKLATGLRTADFYTLRPISEQPPSNRPANAEKFLGRDGLSYTTDSKGGLIREVRIPEHLAEKLERFRLDEPVKVVDRGVSYNKHYDITAGKLLSNAFGQASIRALGWSRGVHGLRHTYAQERMKELQNHGLSYERALETVSQELGHFSPNTTLAYLR